MLRIARRGHEGVGQETGERAEHADSDDDDDHAEHATHIGDGVGVAVAHGRNRHE